MVVFESKDAFARIVSKYITTGYCYKSWKYKVQKLLLASILRLQGTQRVTDPNECLELIRRVRAQVLVELDQALREDGDNRAPTVRKPT